MSWYKGKYFTLRTAIGERNLQGKDIGVVETTRARPGWPCPKFRHETDDYLISLYSCDDKEGFYIFCWVNDNIVRMVSSTNTREEMVFQKVKMPRKNATNKNHLPQSFGDKTVSEIEIPGVVDDYN